MVLWFPAAGRAWSSKHGEVRGYISQWDSRKFSITKCRGYLTLRKFVPLEFPQQTCDEGLIPTLLTEEPRLRATRWGHQMVVNGLPKLKSVTCTFSDAASAATYTVIGLCYPLGSLTENVNSVHFTSFKIFSQQTWVHLFFKEKLFIAIENRKPISWAAKNTLQNKNTGNRQCFR